MARRRNDAGCEGCLGCLGSFFALAVLVAVASTAAGILVIVAIVALIVFIVHEVRKKKILESDASEWDKAVQICPFLNTTCLGLAGDDFEEWCCTLLKKLGYRRVRNIGGPGDFGLDIIAEKDGVICGFQCKGYSNKVGPDAVQQAYAGIMHHGCYKGIVVTNSQFTSGARTLAHDCGIELWDYNTIQSLKWAVARRIVGDDGNHPAT